MNRAEPFSSILSRDQPSKKASRVMSRKEQASKSSDSISLIHGMSIQKDAFACFREKLLFQMNGARLLKHP
jgi:hypothetical protein